jgi:hypothetical protein
VHFIGTLPRGPGTTEVVVAFRRTRGVSAPSSRVTLAAPFTVASGLGPFRVGDVLDVVFSPEKSPLPDGTVPALASRGCGSFTGDPALGPNSGGITLGFDGACIPEFPTCTHDLPNYWEDPPFDGHARFHTVVLSVSTACDVTVHVRAETGGSVDPAFSTKSFVFEGLEERTVQGHILPALPTMDGRRKRRVGRGGGRHGDRRPGAWVTLSLFWKSRSWSFRNQEPSARGHEATEETLPQHHPLPI